MNRLSLNVLVLFAACGAPAVPGPPTRSPLAAGGTATLEVTITGIQESRKGNLMCDVWRNEQGWPDLSDILDVGFSEPVSGASRVMTVRSVPVGRYSISCLHDQNENGTMDFSFVGAPLEGFGASNNLRFPARGPTFEEASVVVADEGTTRITVELIY
jgi:uncharacterized protein (DUF2141 family)